MRGGGGWAAAPVRRVRHGGLGAASRPQHCAAAVASERAGPPASEPASQPAGQPASQPTSQPLPPPHPAPEGSCHPLQFFSSFFFFSFSCPLRSGTAGHPFGLRPSERAVARGRWGGGKGWWGGRGVATGTLVSLWWGPPPVVFSMPPSSAWPLSGRQNEGNGGGGSVPAPASREARGERVGGAACGACPSSGEAGRRGVGVGAACPVREVGGRVPQPADRGEVAQAGGSSAHMWGCGVHIRRAPAGA